MPLAADPIATLASLAGLDPDSPLVLEARAYTHDRLSERLADAHSRLDAVIRQAESTQAGLLDALLDITSQHCNQTDSGAYVPTLRSDEDACSLLAREGLLVEERPGRYRRP